MANIKASAVRKKIKDAGFRMASNLTDALERAVDNLVNQAITNCKANNEKTVQNRHLPADSLRPTAALTGSGGV
jgi:hypothetical protein